MCASVCVCVRESQLFKKVRVPSTFTLTSVDLEHRCKNIMDSDDSLSSGISDDIARANFPLFDQNEEVNYKQVLDFIKFNQWIPDI